MYKVMLLETKKQEIQLCYGGSSVRNKEKGRPKCMNLSHSSKEP